MIIDSHLETQLKLAEQVCQEKYSRLTPIRKQVLTILLQTEKAISAYELMEQFEHRFDRELVPMTAYRTLEFLESVHLAHRLNIANKYVACSHIGCDFSHELPQFLVCQECLKVDELKSQLPNSFSQLTDKAQLSGYQLNSPQIELNCICTTCLSIES